MPGSFGMKQKNAGSPLVSRWLLSTCKSFKKGGNVTRPEGGEKVAVKKNNIETPPLRKVVGGGR